MMRLLKSNTLVFIGLFLGLVTGAVILSFKHWLINEIISSLEEEVKASCDCSLAFDSFSLSFTTLSGRARNVRIVEKGIPRLSFKDIRAKIDLSEIREKKVHLATLVLNAGTADGVGPDSVTFRFIDQLTTPLPPEKQDPDRWRVILDTLEVKDSFLRESFGESEISGSGVGLFVKRIDETFSLLPRIADFRYTSYGTTPGEPPSELFLGPLSGSIVIEDAKTLFNSLLLGRGRSRIEAKAVLTPDQNNKFEGTTSFILTPDYLGLPDWLRGMFIGTTDIAGTIDSPTLTGSMTNASNHPLTLAFPYASDVAVPNFTSAVNIDVNHGDPVVTLSEMLGTGNESTPPQTKFSSTRNLVYSDKGLNAGFAVSVPNFSYGPFAIKHSSAQVSVTEGSAGLVTDIDVTSQDLSSQGVSLGPATIRIRLTHDQVEVSAHSVNKAQGALAWQGVIDLSQPQPILTSGTLKLDSFRYPLTFPIDENKLSPVALTSQFSLHGPIDLARLAGEGNAIVAFPALASDMTLSGTATLKDGAFKVLLPDSRSKGSAELSVDLVKTLEGKLRFLLPKIQLQQMLGYEDPCSFLGGSLNYGFKLGHVLEGSGELALDTLSIGCQPYSLSLPANTKLPIRNGALQFKNVGLATLDSILSLDGEMGIPKGFDLSAKGRLELSSLLPLLPAIDDLQGNLKTDISIKGALGEPTVVGTAQLSKGTFGVSTPEIEAHDINGTFTLAAKSIKIEQLSGTMNNGSFTASGTLLPFEPAASSLQTTFAEVSIEPIEDASLTFSGDLKLGVGASKRQTLSGKLDVTFAEIAKDFDINKIIMSTISGFFLPTRAQPSSTAAKKPVEIDMDVKISAPRNLFIITPFLSAELNAQLHARGSTAAPAIDGTMQILSGWIGLKGNRFDITSGGLSFKPSSLVPSLEISSEGSLRAPSGESILVILEASGPISNPKIALTSDRGLSQSELLLILTSSRPLGESSLRGRMDSQFGTEQRFFASDTSFSSFSDFFSSLTRLDVLSFEPAYNQFTGTIEPAVVARKNISPRLTLVGESLFSSVSNSRAGGVYALTPSLDINAFFQTVSTQKNSILSSDLTYTVWAEESRFVSFSFEGLNEFNENGILTAARLGPSSRIINTEESLSLIRNQVSSYLHSQGYRDGSVRVTCTEGDKFCRHMNFSLTEGSPTTISEVVFEGGQLAEELSGQARDLAAPGTLATTTVLDTIERRLVLALRNEGYISARITPSYRHSTTPGTVTLVVATELREPISFVFTGNTVFSPKDFLNSIDLFTRKRPFGNNTIKLLVQNIEQMYLEEGYLFVQVSYTEDRSTPGRLTYHVTINEESPISVRKVSLTGNTHISREKLIRAMSRLGMADQVKTLEPSYAIPSELDALQTAILTVYQDEGFPNVVVNYAITPRTSGEKLDIEFTIVEGEPRRANEIIISGYPASLTAPIPPGSPVSLPRLNRYVDTVVESLTGEGYLYPAVMVDPVDDFSIVRITVEPGSQTFVSAISYEGLIRISEETASRSTAIQVNEPLRTNDINATKRDLLRSGLFSRVEVAPQDGAFNDPREAIIVRVVERPLQTLELGVGANSEFGLHTFGEAVNKSLFADGRTLSLRVDTYFDEPNINPSGSGLISQGFTSLRYADPALFDSDYSLTEEVRYQRQELATQEFNLDRLLVGSYVFRQLRSDLTFSAGHSLVFDNLQDVTPGAIISDLDDGSVRLSFLSSVIKLDKRNDPLIPTKGYTFSFEPKVSFEGIGSQANFGAAIARGTAIIPFSSVSSRYSLGLGLSGGLAQPWGDTEEIPITQRMYLGGRTTVRGFRENSLGPRGEDGAVIGGDTMLATKTQFQYLATDSLNTHLFFDMGNVWLRHREFELSDIRKSVGIGFQYLSPIGPIGFDIGRPLDEKSGEPSVRVHFSVGSMF
jgi:outer membrane protein insertion porin family